MNLYYTPAQREQLRLRMGLSGVAGSGKTFTAITLAQALSPDGRFAVIDTTGRAAQYADTFGFGLVRPRRADPAELPEMIAYADHEGYGALVIDSWSHYWSGSGGALDRVDQLADKRSAWAAYRPVETAMMDAIRCFSGHLILTLRVHTHYAQSETADGTVRTTRIGTRPDQREWVEYEMDLYAEMDEQHTLSVYKTACPALVDARLPRPGVELAETLREWLGQGVAVPTLMDLTRTALDPATTWEQLRGVRDLAVQRQLMDGWVVDERGMAVQFSNLVTRLGRQRRPAAPPAAESPAPVGG